MDHGVLRRTSTGSHIPSPVSAVQQAPYKPGLLCAPYLSDRHPARPDGVSYWRPLIINDTADPVISIRSCGGYALTSSYTPLPGYIIKGREAARADSPTPSGTCWSPHATIKPWEFGIKVPMSSIMTT